jgi:RNA polymerase sigma factor (sigma-70 family)
MEPTDAELLALYVRDSGDGEQAFAELMRRHEAWVFAAARRIVGRNDLAEDVAQAAFVVLARKAASLRSSTSLAAWLHGVVRLAAKSALRAEARRRRHEEAAMPTDADRDATFAAIANELEPAIARLPVAEREAVLRRFFRGESYPQIATALSTTAEAARKRADRGLSRLRAWLTRGGTHALAPAAFGELLMQRAAPPRPPLSLFPSPAAIALAEKVRFSMALPKLLFTAAAVVLTIALGIVLAMPPTTGPASLVATLDDGVVIELLGVGESPSTHRPWWRADGSPVETPYARLDAAVAPYADQVGREVAFRVTDPAKDSDHPAVVRLSSRGGIASSVAVDAKGQWLFDLATIATVVGRAEDAFAVSARIASGEYTTVLSFRTGGLASPAIVVGAITLDPDGQGFLTLSDTDADSDSRLVAEDRRGQTHVLDAVHAGSGGSLRQQTFSLGELDPADVREYRFQTRPFHATIEWTGIAARAGVQTTPAMTVKPRVPVGG